MRLRQLFEREQVQEVEQISKDNKFWEMVSHLDENLPDAAQEAISAWVGGDVKFKDTGAHAGFMIANKLEHAFEMVPSRQSQQVRVELNEAMAPIRAYLRSKYGDKIEVHRGYGREIQKRDNPVVGGVETRRLLSYTSDKRVANHFAGAQPSYTKVLTDEQIDALVKRYIETGKTRAFNKTYTYKVEEFPEMKMGKVEYKQPIWIVDDGKEKHTGYGPDVSAALHVLIKLNAFDLDHTKSKLGENGGVVVTKNGRTFKITKDEDVQVVDDRVPTGKMIRYDAAVVSRSRSDDEEDDFEDDVIDGTPDDIRKEIEWENNARKEHNAEQEKFLRRVQTVMVSVDDIVWVTDRFNQQEFIVYVGNDESKLNPKFD